MVRFNLGLLKRWVVKAKINVEILNKIKNFEDDTMSFLCVDCQHKMVAAKRQNRNILVLVSKKKHFCVECNDKLAEYATKIFVKVK